MKAKRRTLIHQELGTKLNGFIRRNRGGLSAKDRDLLDAVVYCLKAALSRNDHEGQRYVSLVAAQIKIRDTEPQQLTDLAYYLRANDEIWPIERLFNAPPVVESCLVINHELEL